MRNANGTWSTAVASKAYLDHFVDGAAGPSGKPVFAIGHDWTSTAVYGDPGIQFADHSGQSWAVERVTDSCTQGQEGCGDDETLSVAVASGAVHVAFLRMRKDNVEPGGLIQGIHHAYRTSTGAWTSEVIAVGEDLGPYESALGPPNLAAGPNGALHIVWSQRTGVAPGVWYASNATGAWVSTRLSSIVADAGPKVVVSPANQVVVALPTASGLRLRTRTGSAWGGWTTVSAGRFFDVDLAVDGAGKIHASVGRVDGSQGAAGIAYVSNVSGSWTTTDVAGGQANSPSIAVTAGGIAHIAYQTATPSPGISYATNATGSWVTTVVAADYAMTSVAYAVDGRGVPHVALARQGVGGGIDYGTGAGAWSLTRVSSHPDAGVALAVDVLGVAHLLYGTYFDSTGAPLPNPSIYYMTNKSGAWTTTRIGGNAGTSTRSLVLDRSGHLHAAYTGNVGGVDGLVYATNTSGQWVEHLLTTEPDSDASLAVDGDGHIHIAATRGDTTFRSILYATDSSGAWTVSIRTAGSLDFWPSIAVGPDNRPAIAFSRIGAGVLLYELRSTGWTSRVVSTDPNSGPPSLVIDANGRRNVLVGNNGDYGACPDPLCRPIQV